MARSVQNSRQDTALNTRPHSVRNLVLFIVSLSLVLIVVLLAQTPHAAVDEPSALTTRVAAATNPPPTVVAIADPPGAQKTQASNEYLFFGADRDGYRELYAATRETIGDPARWRQLTTGYSPARAPALSPDNSRLAFQSRKDGNWEIYVLDLDTAKISRLTNNLAYDGAPTWSPDAKQIAFESYRAQDLDVWRMNADGSSPMNLTADSTTYDFSPVWSPDGKTIVFTRWANGHKQLFAMSPDGKNLFNLSNNRFHDEQAAWSPDGKQIAFVSNREGCAEKVEATLDKPPLQGDVASGNCQRRGIFVGAFDGTRLSKVEQLTALGRDVAPAWSPDGMMVAFISARAARNPIYVVPGAGGVAEPLNDDNVWIGSVAWSNLEALHIGTAPVAQKALYFEKPIPSNPEDGSKYDFVGLKEVYLAPSYGILSSTVSQSFRSLRARVVAESGVDFLATLSDMTRSITYRCDNTCDDVSWHKSGRAVDTLLTLLQKGRETIVLVREDTDAEVYWHVYLRAAKQDGSQGEPLKDPPWDISQNARANLAPGLGGLEGDVEYGYFVDFTELAGDYGWSRITSHDDVNFDWRNNYEGLEYWHFQKEDGLSWWQAMNEVYPPGQLSNEFDWRTAVKIWNEFPYRLYLKDMPPPPDAWEWYRLVAK